MYKIVGNQIFKKHLKSFLTLRYFYISDYIYFVLRVTMNYNN